MVSEPPDITRPASPAVPGGSTPSWLPAAAPVPTPAQDQPAQDQPAGAPPARDRLAAHLVWEGILLVLAAGLTAAALTSLHQVALTDVLHPVGYLGLIAAGLAHSRPRC